MEILWNTVVDEIVGTDRVEKIRIRNTVSGDMEEMEMDGVFIAVGIHPNTELFKGLVECDEKGYIAAGEDGVTTAPGILRPEMCVPSRCGRSLRRLRTGQMRLPEYRIISCKFFLKKEFIFLA